MKTSWSSSTAPDAGALMRRLDNGKHTKDGKPGNMYVNLADDDRARPQLRGVQ